MALFPCPRCGSLDEGHVCQANDNTPDKVVKFDAKAWRRDYMRRYMRELRQRMREEQRR